MSSHMLNSQLPRRTSRSSGTQLSRSSRVEKPKSHHNSPRTMERRKTTTEPKLYATLDDHYKMMFGIEDSEEEVEERPQPTRPVSWHPSSNQWFAPRSSAYVASPSQQEWAWHAPSRNSIHGSDFYSLSTRNSMHDSNTNHQMYPAGHGMHRGSDESDYSWQGVPQQTQCYAHSAINTPTTEPLPWYLQQWAQKNQAHSFMDSQNGSAEFLPIQHPSDHDQMDEEDDGKELVGMGLYDAPDPTANWGGLVEATGKGLKLEETWQPPEADDDEEDDDDDDDASSEGSMDEPSPPLPATNPQSQQLQLPVHVKAQTPGSMEGQSFFFDDDETVSKEWWFQQLKQPNVPVQDAGLGYGWLR